MDVLMVLLILSFSGIFLFVIYMDYLNKRIDKLENKIGFLQWQTDDVLHDINAINENIRNYYVLLKKLEDEKIDAEINLKNLWHDPSEEPQNDLELIIYEYKDNFWFTKKQNIIKYHDSWKNFVVSEQMLLWAYVKDLFPKENKK